jgi:hypothetical protein
MPGHTKYIASYGGDEVYDGPLVNEIVTWESIEASRVLMAQLLDAVRRDGKGQKVEGPPCGSPAPAGHIPQPDLA